MKQVKIKDRTHENNIKIFILKSGKTISCKNQEFKALLG